MYTLNRQLLVSDALISCLCALRIGRQPVAQTQSMTIEEFEVIDEPGRFDLIRGELVCLPPTGGRHGELATELARHVANYVAAHGLGKVYINETGFVLAEEPPVVLAPDLAFVRSDRLPPREDRVGFLRLPPDLAVEIVTPSDRMTQVGANVDEYLNAGAPLVWVIELQRRRATVHRPGQSPLVLSEGDAFDGLDVLLGFRLPVGRIFD